jgi:hypothetical protein
MKINDKRGSSAGPPAQAAPSRGKGGPALEVPAGFTQLTSGLVVPSISAAQYSLYSTPRSSGQLDSYRQRWFTTGDIRRLVTDYDRLELLSYSRQLFAGLGNMHAAIIQKAHRSVGEEWRALYCGTETKWGDEVEEWLEDVFYPNCDLRGPPYDFVTDLVLSSIAWDVDGDDAMILTEDGDTQFPKLQFIPTHRINTRMANGAMDVRATEGWASGSLVSQGIIYDSNMKVIGLRILGDGEVKDRDVPMTGCQLMYDPEWQSQNRGLPAPSCEIMGGLDYQDFDAFIKRGVKKATSMALLRTTESGQADTGVGFVAETPLQDFSPGVKREQIRGGEDYFLTANKGEKVEGLKYEMPSESIEGYIHRLEHRIILACGWYAELLNPSEVGGASVRLIQDNARATVKHRQKSVRMRALRAIRYAVAKAMKHGWISRNEVDWWKWDFELPALITVDEGRDARTDLSMLGLGVMTESKYHAKYGDSGKQVARQKDAEVTMRIKRGQAIAEATGTAFEWVYQQLWSPPGNHVNSRGSEEDAEGETAAKVKAAGGEGDTQTKPK